MNALQMAKTAYESSKAPIRSTRGTEYDAFALITRRLATASAAGLAGFRDLAEAVHQNRRLWTILAADVASGGNGLPNELRARIFYLAQFTSEHSRKVLNGNADTQPLVDVNTAVMRGLRQVSEAS